MKGQKGTRILSSFCTQGTTEGQNLKKQVKIPANKDLSKANMETTCKQKKRFYLPDG